MTTLLEFWSDLRWVDLLDVTLVSSLLFLLVLWIRNTQAGFVALGLFLFGLVYLLARALDLSLLTGVFEGSFAVFLIIVVVIFQEELRQLFERVAVAGLRVQSQQSAQDPGFADRLADAVARLARGRVGALIVIPGVQPLDRLVHSGIELGGRFSPALLESLFDASSPGHDGAVLLKGDRIDKFAVHLPLSQDGEASGERGTRHSAALGLSERSDATCIVVSEESGAISVARNGTLMPLTGPSQLGMATRNALIQGLGDGKSGWREALRLRWPEALGSTIVVVGLWFAFVAGALPAERTVDVAVRALHVPEELAVETVDPERVQVTLAGVRRSFYFLRDEHVQVTFDAGLARLGRRTFTLRDSDVERPTSLRVVGLEPERVRIRVRDSAVTAP